jgi:hypothetical protein
MKVAAKICKKASISSYKDSKVFLYAAKVCSSSVTGEETPSL